MNEMLLLYLWTRLDSVNFIFNSVASVSFFITVISGIGVFIHTGGHYGCSEGYIKEQEMWKATLEKVAKRSLTIALIMIPLAVAVPTKKDAAIIAGGWAALKTVQSDEAKQIGEKTLKLINGKLDEQIKELK